jgi:hypothetical protein
MSKSVWENAAVRFPQGGALQFGGMPLYDFIDAESCERLPLLRYEDRSGYSRLPVSNQLPKQLRRFRPDRTTAPLVSLSVKADTTGFFEIYIRAPKVRSLLDPGARVVEEHQKCAVP